MSETHMLYFTKITIEHKCDIYRIKVSVEHYKLGLLFTRTELFLRFTLSS